MGGNVGIGKAPSYLFELSTDSAGKPSTNTWTIVSDERLKKDIIPADLARCYEIVKTLPLKRFTWRDEMYSIEQVPDRSKLGWISQDVQPIFKKSVNTVKFEGQSKKDGSRETIEDCLGLNADQIYAVLYGAVQLLMQKVEALEQKSV